jgi:glycosyltransferase involved in cell wall biosynthesis
MNVALVISGDLDIVSGGYLYDRKLVEHLRARGDQVRVVTFPHRSYARGLLDNLSSSLLDEVLSEPYDVLLQDELNHQSLIGLNRTLRQRSSDPIVSIVHHLRSSEDHPRWRNALHRRLESIYLRSVDGYIFNGETTRSVVESLVGSGRPSVVATPAGDRFASGATDADIAERIARSGPLRVIFLGNVIPRKGLHTLIDALVGLSDSNWTLTVIGRLDVDEPYAASVRRAVSNAGVTDQVTMYGSLPDREIARLLKESDIMAMPSSYEGYGIAYLEGMSFGLPVIATRSGAAWEIVSHGENGWLIPPGDPSAITRILTEIRDDRAALHRMSLAALQRYRAQPGWADTMQNVRSFLHSLTGAA